MSKLKTNKLKQTPKILVYGITGMTGTRIGELLRKRFKIIAPPHTHLNLTNKLLIYNHIEETSPDYIIYSAGLTKVDQAQLNPKLAFKLNFQVVADICKKAKQKNITVIYISTDAVFDGKKFKSPYKENDKPHPLSVYGKSKLEGEKAVLKSSRHNAVIRSIMTYCAHYPHKMDFTRLAYQSLKNNEKFDGIIDQIINPTFVDDLVWAVSAIVEKKASGIYHVAAIDSISNYGFVEKIAKAFRFDNNLIGKVTFNNFFRDKPAPRTKFCWLDTTKFQKEINNNILHTLDEGIAIFKKQIGKIETEPVSL